MTYRPALGTVTVRGIFRDPQTVDACGRCGALVLSADQTTHDYWHARNDAYGPIAKGTT